MTETINIHTINTQSEEDYFSSLKASNKDIVLYGAGAFGRELATKLTQYGVTPLAFLDINAKGDVLNIPLFHPEKFPNKKASIIISIVLPEKKRLEIESYLRSLGYCDISDGQEIRANYILFEKDYTVNPEDIQKPLTYLSDSESKSIYLSNVSAHLERDYSKAKQSDGVQYFADISDNNRFSSFVDCGAYIGDTFLDAHRIDIAIKNYYAFEPIKENFERLEETLSQFDSVESLLFNAGVSSSSGIAYFKQDSAMGSLDASGDIPISIIKLDDLIDIFPVAPNFIKMDIEGQELNALIGAEELIKKFRPNLAICVYHFINHFWDIPNFLHSLNLGYSFYMRTYSGACMETVLYAVQNQKGVK